MRKIHRNNPTLQILVFSLYDHKMKTKNKKSPNKKEKLLLGLILRHPQEQLIPVLPLPIFRIFKKLKTKAENKKCFGCRREEKRTGFGANTEWKEKCVFFERTKTEEERLVLIKQ